MRVIQSGQRYKVMEMEAVRKRLGKK